MARKAHKTEDFEMNFPVGGEEFEMDPEMQRIAELSQPVDATLNANIERICEIARFTRLDKRFLEMSCPYTEFVMKRLNMTEEESILFSLLTMFIGSRCSDCGEIAGRFCADPIRIFPFLDAAKGLKRRQLIRIQMNDWDDNQNYALTRSAIDCIVKNGELKKDEKLDFTESRLFEEMDVLFDEGKINSPKQVLEEIETDIADNQHLPFCKEFDKATLCVSDSEKVMLMVACTLFVMYDADSFCSNNWKGFVDRRSYQSLKKALKKGRSMLQNCGIIEDAPNNGMKDGDSFRITDEYKERFFGEMGILEDMEERKSSDIMSCEDIKKKELFYNAQDESQIARLSSLLQPQNFDTVLKRFEENGMRKGFCCLFYGSPGTGKTETVYQLARETGRDIYTIDVSNIKSCWVGESEKNISNAFKRYANLVKRSKVAPILLFNEADGVLGIRQEGAQRAVDKMENSIQNIILQEMEKLEGIMIATTNLTQNLDSAFERRFIYKIEFHKPDQKAKAQIWKSMISDLKKSEAERLASAFDLSGGQIENVARKRAVQVILDGKAPSEAEMVDYCKAEALGNKKCVKRVGFE